MSLRQGIRRITAEQAALRSHGQCRKHLQRRYEMVPHHRPCTLFGLLPVKREEKKKKIYVPLFLVSI